MPCVTVALAALGTLGRGFGVRIHELSGAAWKLASQSPQQK